MVDYDQARICLILVLEKIIWPNFVAKKIKIFFIYEKNESDDNLIPTRTTFQKGDNYVLNNNEKKGPFFYK